MSNAVDIIPCIQVRCFDELSDEEAQTLCAFTESLAPRDLMLRWLTEYRNLRASYVALLWANGQLIGWASVTPCGWNLARLGVLIHLARRGQGLARQTLDSLLAHVAALPCLFNSASRWTHMSYSPSALAPLFHPAIARAGFGDFTANPEEYRECYHGRTQDQE